MRRSLRNGQLRRVSSISPRSHSDDQQFFPVSRSFTNYVPGGVTNERASPELNTLVGGRSLPGFDERTLMAHTIHRSDKHAVRDGMGSLHCPPSAMLAFADGGFLGRMPADRGRIEKNVGSSQRGQPGCFWIPLIPAHEDANSSKLGVESLKPQIARRGSSTSRSKEDRRECAFCGRHPPAIHRHR